MNFISFPHRFADIILNSDYDTKREIEEIIRGIDLKSVEERFLKGNDERKTNGKKPMKGKQAIINAIFREEFRKKDWEIGKTIFL